MEYGKVWEKKKNPSSTFYFFLRLENMFHLIRFLSIAWSSSCNVSYDSCNFFSKAASRCPIFLNTPVSCSNLYNVRQKNTVKHNKWRILWKTVVEVWICCVGMQNFLLENTSLTKSMDFQLNLRIRMNKELTYCRFIFQYFIDLFNTKS